MPSWLETQIETRKRLDSMMLDRSYAELAASVADAGKAPVFHLEDYELTDGAVCACLRYCGVRPGNVPADVTDSESRIDWLCRPSGTMHRKVRLTGKWYRDAIGPMLGRLDTGEPIALLPGRLGGYSYEEPGSGGRHMVDASVASTISEDAVFFYKPLPARPLKVRDLAIFIHGAFEKTDYLLVIAAALPWVNQLAFGTVVPSGRATLIIPIGALLLGVSVSSLLMGICRNIVMARVSTKLRIATEAATFARVLLLPTSFFKDYESGNLASRVSQVTALMQLLTSMVLGAGLTVVCSVVYVFQIATYTPVLVVPALVVTFMQALLTTVVARVSSRRQLVAMEAQAGVSGLVTALLGGIQKIKLSGAEDRAFSKWAHSYSTYARAMYNQPMIERALPAIVSLISMLGTLHIYYFAGISKVPIADYIAFNVAYGQLTAAIMGLANLASQIAQIRPLMNMVSPILDASPEIDDSKPSIEHLSGSIEMTGVTFRYNENSPYVLEDLSLRIRPGEYVALVGKSGCGKSTIMRLLLGFETPERGSIFYGPYDVSKVDLRSLRQSIGMVMQDGKLFLGDIASNITIASPGATLDDAWEAAEIAGIADDIRKMPMGMQTLLSEGAGGISGGQRQRIMIARAVCGKRRILMLDEATSALDNVTQKHVSDSLETLKCTRLVVAHRLSTVRHCDRILLVDGGRIAEEGTYDELIARGGLFADLVARQRLE